MTFKARMSRIIVHGRVDHRLGVLNSVVSSGVKLIDSLAPRFKALRLIAVYM